MSPPPEYPQSLRDLLAEAGPKWSAREHLRLVYEAYDAILRDAPKEGTVTRDIAYGPDPRNVLDLYMPRGAVHAPVIVFVHGGAFTEGDKDRSTEIHANIGWYFARHGVGFANIEYRLAPVATYPAGTEDVAAAVAWVRRNVGKYGGDPGSLFLMGHSAGGAHAGCYALNRKFHPADGPGVKGFISLSGRLSIDTLPENPNADRVRAYFRSDEALMAEGSVVRHAAADSMPVMIAVAQYENPLLDVYGLELAHRLAVAKRRAPRIVWLAGHNHGSIVGQFNTADDRLGREILEFIRLGH